MGIVCRRRRGGGHLSSSLRNVACESIVEQTHSNNLFPITTTTKNLLHQRKIISVGEYQNNSPHNKRDVDKDGTLCNMLTHTCDEVLFFLCIHDAHILPSCTALHNLWIWLNLFFSNSIVLYYSIYEIVYTARPIYSVYTCLPLVKVAYSYVYCRDLLFISTIVDQGV